MRPRAASAIETIAGRSSDPAVWLRDGPVSHLPTKYPRAAIGEHTAKFLHDSLLEFEASIKTLSEVGQSASTEEEKG
jgi:hypothetical protein